MKIDSLFVKSLLNEKYSDGDASLIAFEVNEGTGGNAGRIADAVSFALWPSKKYQITGFEIKVSRQDWLNEMKQPDKSQSISKYCDKWYLVAPKGVLGIDELPKTWGYIEVSERLITKIKAPDREVVEPTRSFMASLVRQLIKKYSDKHILQALIDGEKEKIEKRYDSLYESRFKHKDLEITGLKKLISNFEEESGLKLNNYNMGKIADAVKALNDPKSIDQYLTQLKNQVFALESTLKGCQVSIDLISNFKKNQEIKND